MNRAVTPMGRCRSPAVRTAERRRRPACECRLHDSRTRAPALARNHGAWSRHRLPKSETNPGAATEGKWCRSRGSNPDAARAAEDFKSSASANSATPAHHKYTTSRRLAPSVASRPANGRPAAGGALQAQAISQAAASPPPAPARLPPGGRPRCTGSHPGRRLGRPRGRSPRRRGLRPHGRAGRRAGGRVRRW